MINFSSFLLKVYNEIDFCGLGHLRGFNQNHKIKKKNPCNIIHTGELMLNDHTIVISLNLR